MVKIGEIRIFARQLRQAQYRQLPEGQVCYLEYAFNSEEMSAVSPDFILFISAAVPSSISSISCEQQPQHRRVLGIYRAH